MVHGGPGGQARKGYRAQVQYLVNRGYAVLDINNRGSSGYGETFLAADDQKHGRQPTGCAPSSPARPGGRRSAQCCIRRWATRKRTRRTCAPSPLFHAHNIKRPLIVRQAPMTAARRLPTSWTST
jgi:hypothetical protein